MIELRWSTPPQWVARIALEPLELLSDHAHCELRAAASAQTLISRNPGLPDLVRELAQTARTELEHFERVVTLLYGRGGRLGPARPSPYAAGLQSAPRSAASQGRPLLERLLVSGLIEARSLERFHLLATHLEDPELAELYRELLASEASHRVLFHRLALRYHDAELVATRLAELARHEARILSALPFAPRVHSGAL